MYNGWVKTVKFVTLDLDAFLIQWEINDCRTRSFIIPKNKRLVVKTGNLFVPISINSHRMVSHPRVRSYDVRMSLSPDSESENPILRVYLSPTPILRKVPAIVAQRYGQLKLIKKD